jgi:AcrR family transcriptional regulator
MSKRQKTLHARVSAAILEAAAAVLAERGEQASMADVATAAGMARATVYRYFPNREALFEALGRLAVEEAGERLQAARLQEVPVPDAFERAVRALVAIGDSFVARRVAHRHRRERAPNATVAGRRGHGRGHHVPVPGRGAATRR